MVRFASEPGCDDNHGPISRVAIEKLVLSVQKKGSFKGRVSLRTNGEEKKNAALVSHCVCPRYSRDNRRRAAHI